LFTETAVRVRFIEDAEGRTFNPTTSRQTNDHDSFAFVWAFTLRVCMINYDSFALLTTIRLLLRTSIIYKLSLATRLGYTFLL
jgi:hypothetical protein